MKGTITLSVLSLITSVIVGTAVSVFAAVQYVNTQIMPLQTQIESTAVIEAQTHQDVQWIKAALASRGFSVPADPPSSTLK